MVRDIPFKRKNVASPFVYLQMKVLTAFCTLKSCANLPITVCRSSQTLFDESILHSLMVGHSCEITVVSAKGDSGVMFCLQSFQGLGIDRSLVY